MTKNRTLLSSIPVIVIIGLVIFPIVGLGLSRQEYVVDFFESTQDEVWGAFSEYNTYSEEEGDTQTTLATRSALEGLNILNAIEELDTRATKSWVVDRINGGIDFNSLINLSECVESLYYIDLEELQEYDRVEDIKEFADNRSSTFNNSVGYALDIGLNASIFGTYYVVKTYYYLDIVEDLSIPNVTNFILDSLDGDGGFKSSPNNTGSSLTSTFYAIQTLWYLNSLDSLSQINKTLISQYLTQFYVFDSSLKAHYGGYSYSPEEELPFATVRATFEAVVSLSLLDLTIPNRQSTIDWVLQNQNQADGGFCENLLEGTEQRSSTITSVQSIRILNELGSLDSLSEKFGDYKLRWWIILIVILVVLGAGIGVYFYYQRRIKL